MTILDTPDYAKPLPGGSRTLIDTGFNMSVAGGVFTTGWFDVTSFSGLYIETNGFGLVTSFGSFQVQFQDVGLFQPIFPKWSGVYRGDLPLRSNVPILGAQARVQITGPADNANATLLVVGHGGGPGTDVGPASDATNKIDLASLGAGGTFEATSGLIREGAADLFLSVNGQPGQAWVQSVAANGALTDIGGLALPAKGMDTRRIWLPPQPIFLNVQNTGAAADAFTATLTRERS